LLVHYVSTFKRSAKAFLAEDCVLNRAQQHQKEAKRAKQTKKLKAQKSLILNLLGLRVYYSDSLGLF
jgi:hypothetical protein